MKGGMACQNQSAKYWILFDDDYYLFFIFNVWIFYWLEFLFSVFEGYKLVIDSLRQASKGLQLLEVRRLDAF